MMKSTMQRTTEIITSAMTKTIIQAITKAAIMVETITKPDWGGE